jgi:hypothetical protein
MKTIKKSGITFISVIFFTALTSFYSTSLQAQVRQYTNPGWAPAYYSGVRYYYIPDIETFYDLVNQDFVYLDDGQWQFSDGLPPMYSGFDLYNAYVVALDLNVFQPWMHFHLYVSNYPRYYYRNLYNKTEIANIRGFNENQRKPFYWTPEARNGITEVRKTSGTLQKTRTTRPPQNINYYGKNIGQPVKVKSQMKENTRAGHVGENTQGGHEKR